MTDKDLFRKIRLLKKYGVSSFKSENFFVSFFDREDKKEVEEIILSTEKETKESALSEEDLLFWSSPGEGGD